MRISRSEANREVKVRTLDLAKIFPDFRNDPVDREWPWIVRINIFLIDRDGRARASQSAILELEPAHQRIVKAKDGDPN